MKIRDPEKLAERIKERASKLAFKKHKDRFKIYSKSH